MNRIKLFDVPVDALTLKEAIQSLEAKQIIFTPNPEILLTSRNNKKFKKALENGSLFLADGHGLQFVSTLMQIKSKFLRAIVYTPALFLFLVWKKPFSKIIPQVIHGSDFLEILVSWAEVNGKSVFFLGAKPEIAKKTAEFFKSQHPGLKIAGASSTDPGKAAFQEVRDSKAEVIFVAYGAPKQEMWIAEYADKLPNRFHIMGVGGSFDFWSGNIPRAPKFMRSLGLEWLWRLIKNPRQRVTRIWNALVRFPLLSLFS